MKQNNFKDDLEYSETASCEDFWQKVYEIAFPDMQFAMATPGATAGQMMGIDRVIYLKSGKTIYIDEKKRRTSWNDILLEYKSNGNGSINNGWMNKNLLIDYIAYAFMDTETVYLLDWLSLRRIWLNNGAVWNQKAKAKEDGFKIVKANNGTYITESIAVPISILLAEMNNTIIVNVKRLDKH